MANSPVPSQKSDLKAASFAHMARQDGLGGPCDRRQPRVSTIIGGRHPVVEEALRQVLARLFVANDCKRTETPIWLLTGPKHGGKSTYLRQNALICVLAQIGAFVCRVSAYRIRAAKFFRPRRRVAIWHADDQQLYGRDVRNAAILNQGPIDRALVILR